MLAVQLLDTQTTIKETPTEKREDYKMYFAVISRIILEKVSFEKEWQKLWQNPQEIEAKTFWLWAILMKGLFSDFEILAICWLINSEDYEQYNSYLN